MRITMLIAATALAGCAGAPVGWGGTDEVLFSNADTIKIQWDSLTTSDAAVEAKARSHCRGDAQVVDASADALTMGLVRSKTWRCTSRSSAVPTFTPNAAPAAASSPIPGCGWVGHEWKCAK